MTDRFSHLRRSLRLKERRPWGDRPRAAGPYLAWISACDALHNFTHTLDLRMRSRQCLVVTKEVVETARKNLIIEFE